jgi:hypothetical protein
MNSQFIELVNVNSKFLRTPASVSACCNPNSPGIPMDDRCPLLAYSNNEKYQQKIEGSPSGKPSYF